MIEPIQVRDVPSNVIRNINFTFLRIKVISSVTGFADVESLVEFSFTSFSSVQLL